MLFQMDFFPTMKLLYSVYFKTIFIFFHFSSMLSSDHFFVFFLFFYVPQNTFILSSHLFFPTIVFQLVRYFSLSYLSDKFDIYSFIYSLIYISFHLYICLFILYIFSYPAQIDIPLTYRLYYFRLI